MTTSIVLATYNGAKYIEQQLLSIINQTILPNQIVITDDDSQDNTLEIVESTLKNSGIDYVIHKNPKRVGITKNYDIGLSLCTEDLIFLCDQDNVWEKDYIETFLNTFLEDENLVYAFCNGYVTDQDLNIINTTFTDDFMNVSKEQFLYNVINKKGFPHGHTVCVKNSFVSKVIPSGFYPDEWLALCAGATSNIKAINKKLIYFRRHNNASTNAERGNKGSALSKIVSNHKKSFDEYFIWPHLQYTAYTRFLELCQNNNWSNIHIESLKKHTNFVKLLSELADKNLFVREYRLLSLYKSKDYKFYRGNINTLISDFIYLLYKR